LISDKEKHKSKLRRILNYALSLLLAAVFLYIAFKGVDVDEVFRIVSHSSIIWMFIFLLVQLSAHYIRAVRWKVILHSVKPEASVKNLFGALMVGYGVNCVIPRLGEVTRAVLAGKWENLSRSSLLGTVILERVIDIIFLGIAVAVAIFFFSESLLTSFPWLQSALYITIIAIGLVIFLFYLLISHQEKFYNVVVKFFSFFSEKLAHKIASIIQMIGEGFGSLKGRKNYFWVFFLSILIIAQYAFSSYVGFFIVGMQEMQDVTFQMGWIVMSISAIGIIIPTPGGTGSYHTLAKSTLVLLFGFPEALSLAYAFITHAIGYFLAIFLSLIIFFVLNKQHDNLIKVVETEIEEL
jgi:glycosyltransferase 2 family protein